MSVLSYPSLRPAFQSVSFNYVNKGDFYDADFSDDGKFVSSIAQSFIDSIAYCPSNGLV